MEKKTTTLVALLNALHSRQYQRYYSEIERITLAESENSMAGKLCFSLHWDKPEKMSLHEEEVYF